MKYTKEHEWLKPEGNLLIVGITEHAATALGDVVYVDLPEVGKTFEAGDELSVIESVKAASDILAPMGGEIVEVNEDLVDNPGLVNEDPLGRAWFFKIVPSDFEQYEKFMTEEEYTAFIG